MAQHKSAKKRIKQDIKKRSNNRSLKKRVRTEIKNLFSMIEEKKAPEAKSQMQKVQSLMDKLGKNVIKKKTASRINSRLSAKVSKI